MTNNSTGPYRATGQSGGVSVDGGVVLGKQPQCKNKPVPLLTGIHHMSVPASDPLASSDWYARVLGFATLLIEERENDVVGALLEHPCGARLLLQRTATAAIACAGHPLFGLAVPNSC